MGNVERCDKTLPLNEMIFYVRRDAGLRARWEVHSGRYLEAVRAVGALDRLSEAEKRAVQGIPRDAKPLVLDLPHLSPIFFFEEWELEAVVRDVRSVERGARGAPPRI